MATPQTDTYVPVYYNYNTLTFSPVPQLPTLWDTFFQDIFAFTPSLFLSPPATNKTLEDARAREQELTEENAKLLLENEQLNDLITLYCEQDDMTPRELFVLYHLQRMEEKGWQIAFLSPSVLHFIQSSTCSDFLDADIPFFYDAEPSND